MQAFTKTEITWMAKGMKELSEQRKNLSQMVAATKAEKELCQLNAEQFASIADRLTRVVERGDRRIAVI